MINSKAKNSILLFGILFLIFFALYPNITSAASVYLSSDYPTISVGDTVIISLMIDPQGKNPNVVDGNISIKNDSKSVEILGLSTAGSVLTKWVKSPSVDANSNISFVGGTPGGFNKAGLLFKIILSARSSGQAIFSPNNIKAYNNDEKNTLIGVSANDFTVNVGSEENKQPVNQWQKVIAEDKEPPKDLSAIVGQDASVFGGKKFITISAVDDQSGISYYEIKEGNWPMARTSNEIYILLDQKETSNIVVTAYDKAGNYSKISLKPSALGNNYWMWIIVFVGLLFLLYVGFIILKKIKKN